MAVVQAAWTFDPAQFHATLVEKIVVDGQVRLDLLLDLAKAAVVNPSEERSKALDFIRFDEEWLDPSDPSPNYWYLLALSSVLSLAPSLSTRFIVGWRVMQDILPLAGWDESEIAQLVRGKSLRSLILSAGNRLFHEAFDFRHPSAEGWLSLADIQTLLPHLMASQEYFSSNQQSIEAIEWAKPFGKDFRQLLQDAYADALDMLNTAILRKSALFIVFE
jgi:hypothetical protein